MKHTRTICIGITLALGALFSQGCEDEVNLPEPTASSAGGGGQGGTGGEISTGGAASVSSSSTGGQGGAVSAADEVVVVAGTNQGVDVLYVLDRDTGQTLLDEQRKVVAVSHDPWTDSWLTLESEDLPFPPGTAGRLYAQRFDKKNKFWVPLEVLDPVPLPDDPKTIVQVNRSLLYLSQRNSPPGTDLVAFRVDNPQQIQSFFPDRIDVTPTESTDTLIGLTGSAAGTLNDGTVLVALERNLGSGNCQLRMNRYTILGSTLSAVGTSLAVGSTYACGGKPAWVADDKSSTLIVALPPAVNESDGQLLRVQPKTLSIDQQFVLPFGSPGVRSLANMQIDTCNQVVMMTASNGSDEHGVWTAPLDSAGKASFFKTNSTPVSLSYEPSIRRLFIGHEAEPETGVDARLLKGTCITPVLGALTSKQWTPPVFLYPRSTAAPSSRPLMCSMRCTL